MAAASQAVTKADATRLRRKCGEMIDRAEQLKKILVSTLSAEEKILRHASSLHGNVFPQWKAEPSDEEFEGPSNGENYVYVGFLFRCSLGAVPVSEPCSH